MNLARFSARRAPSLPVLLACVPWLAALWASGPDFGNALRSRQRLAIMSTDALVFEAIVIAIAGPVAGAWFQRSSGPFRNPLDRTIRGAGPFVLWFVAASLLIGLAVSLRGGLDWTIVVRSHASMAAVALALATFGAACATLCATALDGAGAAVLVSSLAAGGVIACGPATAGLPESVINGALIANPVVAVTASAGIDLMRSAPLYDFSPIAHRRLHYPDWTVVVLWYTFAAGLCTIWTGSWPAPDGVDRHTKGTS